MCRLPGPWRHLPPCALCYKSAMRPAVLLLLPAVVATAFLAACTEEPPPEPTPAPSVCEQMGLTERAWQEGETGILRHDLAGPVDILLADGDVWHSDRDALPCDVYVFLPDSLRVSQLDSTSLWEQGVEDLISRSPDNVRYFFIPTRNTDPTGAANAMQARIDDALADHPEADWWRDRLHVAAGHVDDVGGWVEALMEGMGGQRGFGIDRFQRIRLLGNFADVTQFDSALQNAEAWPWRANLAYAAYEAHHYNAESDRQEALDAQEDVTVVTAWQDEVVGLWVENTAEFPSADAMAEFDTLTIDLTMDCPDPAGPEFGSCGAWDYLVHIYLYTQDLDVGPEASTTRSTRRVEAARFVSTYHREGRYVVDATHLLPYLRNGGIKKFRYDISPPWNPQAYLTKMDFRLHKSADVRPTQTHYLWGGRGFNSNYNVDREPEVIDIPATARKVEVRAIISGHGADVNQCAEFCNHQHEFTAGDSVYFHEYPDQSDNEGCIEQVHNGMTPNQGGTWWFGRGGWCPGQQVEPVVFDVTADATPGQPLTVSYRGLFNGVTPPDNSGNIVLSSWLVIYE